MSEQTIFECVARRLEYLRECIEAECISWGELYELQTLGESGFIPEHDILLREWAGLPEFPESDTTDGDASNA